MKPANRRKLITAVLLIMLAILLAEFSSSTLPPALKSSQQQVIDLTRFPVTVAVAADEDPASDRLIEALRATGLFDRVAPISGEPNPDLIAYVGPGIDESARLPLRTILTLGIVPASSDQEWGEVFSLRLPNNQQEVSINFSYSGSKTRGWIATFLNISPERTAGNPRETQRFHDAFSWAVCEQTEQIQALLEAGK